MVDDLSERKAESHFASSSKEDIDTKSTMKKCRQFWKTLANFNSGNDNSPGQSPMLLVGWPHLT
jgi:hypothetical protein